MSCDNITRVIYNCVCCSELSSHVNYQAPNTQLQSQIYHANMA